MSTCSFAIRAAAGLRSAVRRMPAWLPVVALLMAGDAGAGTDPATEGRTAVRVETPVVLVLDASGSMAAALGSETRLDAARRIVLETLATFGPTRPVGLVAYGHRRAGDCADIETLRPIGPVDAPAIRQSLATLRAKGKTPLSAALRHAAALLPAGGGTVMLISDGLETCHEEPCAVVDALRRANAQIVFHVVGFGLAKGEMKRLACIAEQGGGRAIETRDAAGLGAALHTLVETPPPEAGPPAVAAPATPAPEPAAPPPPPPPPTAKPVTLRAMVGGAPVPGAVTFSVTDQAGATAYEGEGTEVTPDLLPGAYRLIVAGGNVRTQAALTVTGVPGERHDFGLTAGLLAASVVATEGLDLKDGELTGDPVWALQPEDGQGPAQLAAVRAPVAMLAPGRYGLKVVLGSFEAEASVTVVAGQRVDAMLDLGLGKATLEAAIAGTDAALDSGTGLSWALVPDAADRPVLKADAVARPTFLAAAGRYKAQLRISGATIEQEATVAPGKITVVRLVLPSATLSLEAALGPEAAAFTDWRDATWTVRPLRLIGDVTAGPALENKAEASPTLVLTPGEWEVTVASGTAATTRRLMLAPGATTRARLDLAAGRLSISAAPEEGAAPPVNVLISLYAATPDGGFAATPMIEAGTRRDHAVVVPAGRYRVVAVDETGRKASADVALEAGASLSVSLLIR